MLECSNIANIISTYEQASGQKVNYNKTQISFNKNILPSLRSEITTRLSVTEVNWHGKYLGLPTIVGRSKKAIFANVKERIWKKLQGWKEKFLSCPSKEVLIKAVIQCIPPYLMSIFGIPKGVINDINSMVGKF